MKPEQDQQFPVILYDGVCVLCQHSVQFVLRHDREARFRFGTLQSRRGRELAGVDEGETTPLDSVLLVMNGRVYRRSSAALRTLMALGWPWRLAGILLVIPPPVRDWVYDFIGARRYRWFGRTEQCMLPPEGWQERFLDQSEAEPAAPAK